jgi:hypothetical protein
MSLFHMDVFDSRYNSFFLLECVSEESSFDIHSQHSYDYVAVANSNT